MARELLKTFHLQQEYVSMISKPRHLAITLLALGAGWASTASANTARLYTPTHVGCLNTGVCFIAVSPSVPSTDTNCTNKNQVRFNESGAGSEGMYKAALSALLAKRTLSISIIGPTGSCINAYPSPEWVLVQ